MHRACIQARKVRLENSGPPSVRIARDPLDTCLSCYFQHFAEGQLFTYDLESLGAYYGTYLRLSEHWHKLLDIPMI